MARRFRPAFTLLFVAALGLAPASTGAADGDRGATVSVSGGARDALGTEVRRALEAELEDVEGVRVVPESGASYRLRGNVRRLDATSVGAIERVACTVSVIVEDRRTGAMRAILEGRARAEGPRGTVERASLVRAAVHGALRPIATTLRVAP